MSGWMNQMNLMNLFEGLWGKKIFFALWGAFLLEFGALRFIDPWLWLFLVHFSIFSSF